MVPIARRHHLDTEPRGQSTVRPHRRPMQSMPFAQPSRSLSYRHRVLRNGQRTGSGSPRPPRLRVSGSAERLCARVRLLQVPVRDEPTVGARLGVSSASHPRLRAVSYHLYQSYEVIWSGSSRSYGRRCDRALADPLRMHIDSGDNGR